MPRSTSANRLPSFGGTFLVLLMTTAPLHASSPSSALWTTPCILLAALLITWGAESAQFFVAQGFALAILAVMQTLPEFAVEGVLAWHQQTALLLANLTGALRLLTGLAWPMIYITAATVYRRRTGAWLRSIPLESHQSVEVAGLFLPLIYAIFIWWKANLHIYDAVVLVAFYGAYLFVLTRLPAQEKEGVRDLEFVPRHIVQAPRPQRIAAIAGCFLAGGALIYFTAEPFLGSLVAVAAAVGIPTFLVIQWLAPVISEFPELASTFYFARQPENASIALVNIASSNINQWTLLMGMLPVVLSLGTGAVSSIAFDAEQQSELLLTIGQSAVSFVFLLNMEFAWWEALVMFFLFAVQLILPAFLGSGVRSWITAAFVVWTLFETARIIVRREQPRALASLMNTWRETRRSQN